MTEQMAIENIKAFRDSEEIYEYVYADEFIESFDMAIKALEEIQQYRALGTVEELREARDKQVAKKIVEEHIPKTAWTKKVSRYKCPCCNMIISFSGTNYCSTCGQKLDWSDEDDI